MNQLIHTSTLPPALAKQAEGIAKKEGRTQSELFREALRRYIQEKQWLELQRYGARQAARAGITEAYVDCLVSEYRHGKK